MKIVFMGTPEFAVAALKALLDNQQQVVAVVTMPDRLGGRGGKQVIQSPVKQYALEKNIPVLQPEKLKNPAFLKELGSFEADVFFVVAFRMLPVVVWQMPPLGSFNIHASLLPRYRGAAPINWAIIRGETETGVTCFKLKHEIDTGDLLLQKKCTIDPIDDFGSLYQKLMQLGADTLVEVCEILSHGSPSFLPQSDEQATDAPKIFLETCRLEFTKSVVDLHNFVRGLSPIPNAFFYLDGKMIKVIKTRYESTNNGKPAGSIQTDKHHGLGIWAADGILWLDEIKPEGKGIMSGKAFLNGLQKVPDTVSNLHFT